MRTIPCPICGTPIPIDIHLLLAGEHFICPKCHSALSLSQDSKSKVEKAVKQYDELMSKKKIE